MKIKHFNARQTVKMSKDQFQKIVQNGADALKKILCRAGKIMFHTQK